MANHKKALGRGLSAILSNPNTDITQSKSTTETQVAVGGIGELLISTIEVNPFQPRTHFDETTLNELVNSINELGVIQPITVRKLGYDKYQLISGERRFRASQLAGLTKIPAYIRVANDQEMLEMALVENIQRQDLDAIEVALSYKLLQDECKLTQEKLSERVGKKRSTVSNYLRLLNLSPIIQAGIRDRMISMGHARSLVNIQDEDAQLTLYKAILKDSLSVRQTEQLAQGVKNSTKITKTKPASSKLPLPFSIQQLTKDFEEKLNSKTEVKLQKNGNGKLIISFKNEDELEHIIQCFQKS
ncbi:MAG: ParB family chromosome partitioning protein [Flavobacteriales bacterium]|jgi:ParB family chromosome partitioning protein|tara:strand:- start:3207 stop:4112 length:906 start_codon:yes stop_codon:yes gene_type:complete